MTRREKPRIPRSITVLIALLVTAVGFYWIRSTRLEEDSPTEVSKSARERPLPTGDQSDGAYRKVVLLSDERVDEVYQDTLSQPMEVAIAPDGRLFFIELTGAVKMWDPRAKTTHTLAELDVWHAGKDPNGRSEEGLLGLALDPDFQSNGFLYLAYGEGSAREYDGGSRGMARVSRFQVEGTTLELASEKVLLEYEMDRGICCHAGGSIEFDGDGNLFIGTGDNTEPSAGAGYACLDDRPGHLVGDSQRTASNSNDLRGKILRIHPEPDGTYTIPEGNLFAPGTPGTRAEIYAMGTRNAFRLGVDTRKGILYWGDPGPDAGLDDLGRQIKNQLRQLVRGSRGPMGYDEINQAKRAGNFGWPYFIGPNLAYAEYDYDAQRAGESFVSDRPLNRSRNNTGLTELPPAEPSFIHYPYRYSEEFPEVEAGGRVAAAGPVYYFDEALESSCKLPRSLDHVLFIYDWMRNWIIAVHLDANESIERLERFVPNMTFKRPADLEIGPDGCMYVVEWGTSWGDVNLDSQIVRIEYRPDLAVAETRTDGTGPRP